MTQVERSCSVAADPGDVWSVLADYGAISTWAPNVDHSCLLTESATGVWAQRRVQVGRSTLVESVVAWESPTTLAYSLEGLPRVIRSVVNTWHVQRHASGATVALTSEIDVGRRPLQKLVARIVGLKLASASEEMLAGLAAHVRSTENTP